MYFSNSRSDRCDPMENRRKTYQIVNVLTTNPTTPLTVNSGVTKFLQLFFIVFIRTSRGIRFALKEIFYFFNYSRGGNILFSDRTIGTANCTWRLMFFSIRNKIAHLESSIRHRRYFLEKYHDCVKMTPAYKSSGETCLR